MWILPLLRPIDATVPHQIYCVLFTIHAVPQIECGRKEEDEEEIVAGDLHVPSATLVCKVL